MSAANDYIPTSYEDLYRYYIKGDGRGNSLVCQIIRTMMKHATPEELEELPEDVFARCLEKKVIETGGSSSSERAQQLGKPGVFDPEKANFGGVIYFVTRTIVSNHLARKERNPLTGLRGGSLVETDPEDGVFEPGVYSLERLFGGAAHDAGARLDAVELVKNLMAWAAGLASKSKANKQERSLLPLINLMAQEYTPAEAAPILGVTPSTIHNWMKIIREKATELQTV